MRTSSRLMIVAAVVLAWVGSAASSQVPAAEWAAGSLEGWDERALSRVFTYAREQGSTGVVVVQGGQLVAERYWPKPRRPRFEAMLHATTSDGRTLEDVASVQKNVVSFLVGRAIAEGAFGLETPVVDVLGSGWSKASKDVESTITVRHLLTMTSGLRPSLALGADPGTVWEYNTAAYSKLVPVLEKTTGSTLKALTKEWLTDPIGMSESNWQPRPWVRDPSANAVGFVTSARDLARFGLLMLRMGDWGGEQLYPGVAFLKESIRPSLEVNPGYGFLWWLNGVPITVPSGESLPSLIPAAPSDLYAAQGALGRKLYVVPSLDLVVTRLGDKPQDAAFNQEFWLRLMSALPEAAMCEDCSEPLAQRRSEAQTPGGEFIRWREHIIDDPTRGVGDLSGSDGLEIGDLDGDGFEDIVSVHESDTVYDGRPVGHVRIAWGSASPSRWELTTLASGTEAAAAEDVSLADVNGDGHLDVIVACELAHLIYFQNPGDKPRETRWERVVPDVTRNRGSYIRAFFADFDGDGRPEVAAANKGEQNPAATADPPKLNISIYRIPDHPLDGSAWQEQVLGQVQVPINAEPFDLDQDGDLDVIAGSRRERRILWFENEGDLKFREHAIKIVGAPPDLAITGFNMDYADLSGDGRIDIVSTAWPGSILLLTQPERFEQPWQFSLIGATPPDQLVSVRLADIDGDDDLDVFVGGYSRGPRDRDGPLVTVNDPLGRILWFENRGAAWIPHTIARPKRGMYDKWLFRDLDGDGDLDALGTRGNSAPYDGVIWLEQLRGSETSPVFEPARRIESQQMGSPERPEAP